jgi:hypothetical protein
MSHAVVAAGVIAALAIAGPVAEASAATAQAGLRSTVASVRSANPPLSSDASAGGSGTAVGPTITGSVFNRGVTIVTSPSPVVVTTNEAP